ncbi:MAG: energy-coupled thiamine transporter ThiT, partial [Clostridia bacterium]|nr:energy-coupled thiamine transporter ThiT [Clostridia bacterium]
KKRDFAISISGAIVMMIRFVCHFLSGILIWGVYAPEGTSVWAYSLLYNGGYMLPEIIISTIVLWLLTKPILSMYKKSL